MTLTPEKFLKQIEDYLTKSWKLFEGKDIVQLEINFKNLIAFVESHLKNQKNIQNAKTIQLLTKSLDFLIKFLNKLIFYDFKLKIPIEAYRFPKRSL